MEVELFYHVPFEVGECEFSFELFIMDGPITLDCECDDRDAPEDWQVAYLTFGDPIPKDMQVQLDRLFDPTEVPLGRFGYDLDKLMETEVRQWTWV